MLEVVSVLSDDEVAVVVPANVDVPKLMSAAIKRIIVFFMCVYLCQLFFLTLQRYDRKSERQRKTASVV